MTPRPLWRGWLFCAVCWAWGRVGLHEWKWLGALMSWCVLPEWLATPEELALMERDPKHDCGEECPF